MKSDLNSLAKAMEAHYVDKQIYPGSGNVESPTSNASIALAANNQVIHVTGDNVLSVVSGTGVALGTFCRSVTNVNGTAPLWYDSDTGGLRRTTCV